jgi:hypothetical protein
VKVQNKVLLEYEKLYAEYSEMAVKATLQCDIEAYKELAADFLQDIARTKAVVLAKQTLVEGAQDNLSAKQEKYTIECPW